MEKGIRVRVGSRRQLSTQEASRHLQSVSAAEGEGGVSGGRDEVGRV